ncbi:hypothetical protein A2U01_0110495, partial [Trifolium medium]|nr:hypothetical protein [Trifolium medium]
RKKKSERKEQERFAAVAESGRNCHNTTPPRNQRTSPTSPLLFRPGLTIGLSLLSLRLP